MNIYLCLLPQIRMKHKIITEYRNELEKYICIHVYISAYACKLCTMNVSMCMYMNVCRFRAYNLEIKELYKIIESWQCNWPSNWLSKGITRSSKAENYMAYSKYVTYTAPQVYIMHRQAFVQNFSNLKMWLLTIKSVKQSHY